MIPAGALKSTELPLSEQLLQAEPILRSAEILAPPAIERLRALVAAAPDTPGQRLSALLVAQSLCSRAQASDLDAILEHQPHYPRFRLQRKLGSGGMGTVFLATDAEGRVVALKTLNPRLAMEEDFVHRFHREADLLAKLSHPNLAKVLDAGSSGEHLFIALEYISGPSLLDLVKQHKRLPEDYSLRIMSQVAAGLHHAWVQARLVHRDVKPENILVLRKGPPTDPFPKSDEARLIDFGLVKPIVTSDEDRLRLTQSGMTIGTPLYMSPEQIRGEELDCRSDVYGIGATLYHLLTGQVPFSGTSPGAIMSAHLTEKVPDPGKRTAELTQSCRDLVMKCMAKDPNERFPTLDDLMQACDQLRAGTAMRFLRKPMPARSAGTSRIARKDPVAGSGVLPMPEAANPEPPKPPRPEPAKSAKPEAPAVRPAPAAPAPRAAPTQPVAPLAAFDLPKAVAMPRSNVFVDEGRSQGLGPLPWIVLGIAVLSLVGYLFYAFALA